MTTEFYVHTAKLKAVVSQIQTLLEAINNDDATPGTPKNFQKASSIDGPTATFWTGGNALAEAYSHEWTYVNDTYTALVQQLNAVLSAAQGTVNGYTTNETDAKRTVQTAPRL